MISNLDWPVFASVRKNLYLLYLRLDEREQQVENRKLGDDIVLDIGESGKIVGIEILDASKHVDLHALLPTHYQITT